MIWRTGNKFIKALQIYTGQLALGKFQTKGQPRSQQEPGNEVDKRPLLETSNLIVSTY
jgi:hypothetical protein